MKERITVILNDIKRQEVLNKIKENSLKQSEGAQILAYPANRYLYLSFCKERGEKPDKTFSGTFNLRIPPELHAKLAFQAKTMGISLNSYVSEKLRSVAE